MLSAKQKNTQKYCQKNGYGVYYQRQEKTADCRQTSDNFTNEVVFGFSIAADLLYI